MAILPSVFIPEETDENPFAPIDAGWYLMDIVKSEVKTTKDKKGKYIALSLKVDPDEPNAGFTIYDNLNIVNPNETAVKIARATLKSICTAVGHDGELEETEDLHNITMAVKVSVKEESAQWPAKNEVKAYRSADLIDSLRGDSDEPL